MSEILRQGLHLAHNNVVLAAIEAREADEDHVLALGHLADAADTLRQTLILIKTAVGKFDEAKKHATRGGNYLDTGQHILREALQGSANPASAELIACMGSLIGRMDGLRQGNSDAANCFESISAKTVALRGVHDDKRAELMDSPAALAEINEHTVAFGQLLGQVLENL